eukprot:TRINITY_DN22238_c0_g1_i1.p1 TRINITY_DN22238_c0_g1~~TRINITY_DN22238_c0_g1_i1.p1  ORF type:complete len:445 (+),score=23.69 TRINITY_DN22238_c0_g1_i1:91-1425(+)
MDASCGAEDPEDSCTPSPTRAGLPRADSVIVHFGEDDASWWNATREPVPSPPSSPWMSREPIGELDWARASRWTAQGHCLSESCGSSASRIVPSLEDTDCLAHVPDGAPLLAESCDLPKSRACKDVHGRHLRAVTVDAADLTKKCARPRHRRWFTLHTRACADLPPFNARRTSAPTPAGSGASPSASPELPEMAAAPAENECAICLELVSEDAAHLLPCRHRFHGECVRKMFEQTMHRVCPLCRTDITALEYEAAGFTVPRAALNAQYVRDAVAIRFRPLPLTVETGPAAGVYTSWIRESTEVRWRFHTPCQRLLDPVHNRQVRIPCLVAELVDSLGGVATNHSDVTARLELVNVPGVLSQRSVTFRKGVAVVEDLVVCYTRPEDLQLAVTICLIVTAEGYDVNSKSIVFGFRTLDDLHVSVYIAIIIFLVAVGALGVVLPFAV